MKVQNSLSSEMRKCLLQMAHSNTIKEKEETDPRTRKEWEELMGKNRDTYRRVHGAVKRR